MSLDLSDTLVVGISATALFDLTEADAVFRAKFESDKETAVAEYRAYMLMHENELFKDGTGMPLVKALLHLNKYRKDGDNPLVEVVVMSRNSPETGVRVFNSIRSQGLAISRHAFTGGESVVRYLDAFDVDLFLTTNKRDAPAEMRVIKTLRQWSVYVNEIFFLGGLEKAKILKAFRPHIFFDDQDLHLDPAAKHVPSGKVPYKSTSPLNENAQKPERRGLTPPHVER